MTGTERWAVIVIAVTMLVLLSAAVLISDRRERRSGVQRRGFWDVEPESLWGRRGR